MIILDTDVLIEILQRDSHRGVQAIQILETQRDELVTTSINIHEIQYGLHKRDQTLPDLHRLKTIPYTKQDAHLSAELEILAEKDGAPIHRIDTMIAAITINNGAKLFTFNQRHFKPLTERGLKLIPISQANENPRP